MAISLFVFPIVQKRYNNRRLYVMLLSFFVLLFALTPLGNLAARVRFGGDEASANWKHEVLVWVACLVIVFPNLAPMCASP